ncbi:unnamed protein product [Ilex paraguariensis]|uniref:LNS2/PITP domain-containing protein n=1 Tax=Ilex paraguariensis TaxID=185542 RepID=A0ABC8UAH7_9AQUA
MYAVERLGNYITRGVYTVSGPFHPFGGAVDIIVVKQQDGSFKSSPWYVRFGKFQGVLKTKEKVVNISVNGAEADFHMYLDHKGEAYFLREVDVEEGESVSSPSSSGEDTDGQSRSRRPLKSKSSNYDADQSNSVAEIDISNVKVMARTNSRRSQILGFMFGRKSMKEDSFQKEEDAAGVVRADSLERAEIAADLLEVRWSTNLASSRLRKDNTLKLSTPDVCDGEADKDLDTNDQQSKVDSLVDDNKEYGLDNLVSNGETASPDHEMGNRSCSSFEEQESSDGETGVEMSCLITECVIRTSTIGQSGLEDNNGLNSETSRNNDVLGVTNAEHEQSAVISGIETHVLQIPDSTELEGCSSRKLNDEKVLDDKDASVSNGVVSKEENGADTLQSLFPAETSESSRIGFDGFAEQENAIFCISCGGCGEVCVHAETWHKTAELISELNSHPQAGLLAAKEPSNCERFLGDKNCGNVLDDAKILEREETSLNSSAHSIVTEMYSQMVNVHPIGGSTEVVASHNTFTISGFSNSVNHAKDENSTREKNIPGEIQSYLEPVGGIQEFSGDCVQTESINISPPKGSREDLLFGDMDDFKLTEVQCVSLFPDLVENENYASITPRGTKAAIESLSSSCEPDSSTDKLIHEKLPNDVEELRISKTISSEINIPTSGKVLGEEVGQVVKSLPNMWSHGNDLVTHNLHHSLGHSVDSNSKISKWTTLRRNVSSFIKSDVDNEDKLSQAQPTIEEAKISEAIGDPSKAIDASSGNWKLWPFPFKQSRNMNITQPTLNITTNPDSENALNSSSSMNKEKDEPKSKVNKRKIRVGSPTSEQLASLNLKEGRNAVKFTFSTAMLGKQQVEAIIYLWRWDTRIVISDVDGTITKSDVLGQFMPLVGRDWSQTGVTHLFSAIKENGYQLLFLSARAISQAYHTRQFLFNLTQDGKVLPDGPVVISPDGLFPSLFREDYVPSLFILRSDVLGQFMPLVGRDWSQTGVTHLFSAIKENGYQLLFLSARAISQAYHTRQFLFNLTQDGKVLPDGPVVISPDGLFPSLFREVIRRAPHEFKIACLEDIKALFPFDRNPFYAGFGNRDTDEFSYLKVGIPKGKIFIINPKGEVAVNHRVHTRSYTTLHDLVHDMFPPMSSSEQEDFNSWNYWKLPPAMDI